MPSGLLRHVGLRRTRARKAVLGVLLGSKHLLSHRQLARRPELAELDRVTLYRTLDVLERRGLVHRVQGLDGVWRFCAHSHSHRGCPANHPHFLCRRCGQMRCLEGQAMPFVQVPEGVSVEGKQLLVYGLCPACAAAGSRGGDPWGAGTEIANGEG